MSVAPEHPNLEVILQLAQFVTAIVVIPGTFALFRVLWAIKEHLARLNGSVRELRQWKEDHLEAERLDQLNHSMTRQQCQQLHAERLANVSKQMELIFQRIGRQHQDITD